MFKAPTTQHKKPKKIVPWGDHVLRGRNGRTVASAMPKYKPVIHSSLPLISGRTVPNGN